MATATEHRRHVLTLTTRSRPIGHRGHCVPFGSYSAPPKEHDDPYNREYAAPNGTRSQHPVRAGLAITDGRLIIGEENGTQDPGVTTPGARSRPSAR